jgi:hypothetical protein
MKNLWVGSAGGSREKDLTGVGASQPFCITQFRLTDFQARALEPNQSL